jgi:hypothetical protein
VWGREYLGKDEDEDAGADLGPAGKHMQKNECFARETNLWKSLI